MFFPFGQNPCLQIPFVNFHGVRSLVLCQFCLPVVGHQLAERARHSGFPVDVAAKRLTSLDRRRLGLVLLHGADDLFSLDTSCWRILSPAKDPNRWALFACFAPYTAMLVMHSRGFHDFLDRKSTRLNSSHLGISYAVF